MEKLLGILPYIYLEEPIQLGDIKLMGIPDWQGRDHTPTSESDKQYLQELSNCFSTTQGLQTNKGGIRCFTYFLLESNEGIDTSLETARKAISLLRYSLLRPDTHALDNVESTNIYVFSLPPGGTADYRLYRCCPNFNLEQHIWINPKHNKFPLPDLYVDCQMIDISKLEDIQELGQAFYKDNLSEQLKDDIFLALEWYNQSFIKYSLHTISGRLVDIATAFETLFQLPQNQKKEEFRKHIKEYLGVPEGSILDNWAIDFYSKARSETVHKGKPVSFLYRHPEAQTPHLSFLLSSQKIFRECISAKIGLPRHVANDRLLEDLIPNEVHLDKLKRAGNLKKILAEKMLVDVQKLKAIYPPGNREDIIWLGKELLKGYKELYNPSVELLPTLESILNSGDVGMDLGLKYSQFLQEFRVVYPDSYVAVGWGEISEEKKKKLKVINKENFAQMQLESTIYSFANFASWALLMPP